ncbi:metallo-beta-lactamase family protein [Thozetella sp. PMI_491]|nr:metallo-beta-lactamase family protein [Thozetella sp. PMI_491]
MAASYDPKATEDLLVCNACGTQFPTTDRASLKTCFICDDPRQFTPPAGQSFSTLAELRGKHTNEFHPVPADARLTSIVSTPKLAIGQRAILVQTPAGNILWDCLTLLDDDTIARIRALGGLHGIVISHPHYYSTHTEWARAFDCPVYLAVEDKEWTAQQDPHQVFLDQIETPILVGGVDTGIRTIKLGGHFPGSLVVLYEGHLLIADTLITTPAGIANWKVNALGETRSRPPGVNSFAFMWSIPNMIPLNADEIARMWRILKRYDFRSTHGAFITTDVEDDQIKQRVLDSMRIQVKYMGWESHPFMEESL